MYMFLPRSGRDGISLILSNSNIKALPTQFCSVFVIVKKKLTLCELPVRLLRRRLLAMTACKQRFYVIASGARHLRFFPASCVLFSVNTFKSCAALSIGARISSDLSSSVIIVYASKSLTHD
jgi:hypothetical protein